MKRAVSSARGKIMEDYINKTPPLPKEEVARLIDLAQAGDLQARNILLETHYTMIWRLARLVGARFEKNTFTVDDLFQEGCLFFFEAIDKYSSSRLGKDGRPKDFLLYAYLRVYWRLIAFVLQKGYQIHQSFALITRQLKAQKALSSLEQKLGRAVGIVDLASELKQEETEVAEVLFGAIDLTHSLDDAIGDNRDFTYHDVLADAEADNFVEQLEKKDLLQQLLRSLASPFYDKEREVLQMHFNLLDQELFEIVPLQVIGDRLGFSSEWVRRTINKAITVIRRKNKVKVLNKPL